MKYILLAFTFALVSISFHGLADDGWTTKEIGTSPSTGESMGRYVTFSKGGETIYRRREFLDPQLVGTQSAKYRESFYIHGLVVLILDRFPDRLQPTFNSFKDFSITVNARSEDSKLQVRAVSIEEEKEYIWKSDQNGFFSEFKSHQLHFTEKQRAVHKKLKEMQP